MSVPATLLIQGVDQALYAAFKEVCDAHSDRFKCKVDFTTPDDTKEDPAISVFLYRIREHLGRRQTGVQLGDRNREAGGRRPYAGEKQERWLELSYMVSGVGKPDAKFEVPLQSSSHYALQMALETLWDLTSLDVVTDRGAVDALVCINQPSEDARSAGELWSALGVKPRPFFDLSVLCPFTVASEPVAGASPVQLNLGFPKEAGWEKTEFLPWIPPKKSEAS